MPKAALTDDPNLVDERQPITPLHLIGRRLMEETGNLPPSYGQIQRWSYACRFPTVRVGSNRAGVAERDWAEAKRLILQLANPA